MPHEFHVPISYILLNDFIYNSHFVVIHTSQNQNESFLHFSLMLFVDMFYPTAFSLALLNSNNALTQRMNTNKLILTFY